MFYLIYSMYVDQQERQTRNVAERKHEFAEKKKRSRKRERANVTKRQASYSTVEGRNELRENRRGEREGYAYARK